MTVFGLWAGVNLVGEDLVGAGLTSPEPPRKASSARVYNQAMKGGLVIGFLLLIGLARPNSAQQTYKPPEVASAGDVYVPYQVVLDGLFVLDVSLDDDGKIQEIDGLRDPGSMLGAAKRSVRQWKFQPASKESKSAPSRMTVSFVYCPSNYGIGGPVPPKHFSPVLPPNQSEPSDHGNYVPVGVLSFAYPQYPVNSVTWGSVVVQLTVDSSGEVKGVDFLHGIEIFNNFVSDALKKWRFQAATFNGKPIKSKTVIGFAFQPPPAS
jgi:TonB family protein